MWHGRNRLMLSTLLFKDEIVPFIVRLRSLKQFSLFRDSHDQFILPLFQLQAISGSRSVCDSQRINHFCDAGKQHLGHQS